MKSTRGKYKFGLLEVGQVVWSTPEMRKGSARSLLGVLRRDTGKTFRLLSDKQGFVVVRTS